MPVSEVEKKLRAYRMKKEREALLNEYKSKVKTLFGLGESQNISTEQEEVKIEEVAGVDSDVESYISEPEEPLPWTTFDYVQCCLWFVLWATVYAIFIKLQFGIIYLIVSGLVGMYLNTRTGPKRRNELSAYSVFNKNCESIDGTLDGEQMTKQMLFGGLSR